MKETFLKKQSRLQSFSVAFIGLRTIFARERNFRTHLFLGLLAILACWVFGVGKSEWIAVVLLIAVVLSAEAFNTCIEYLCDFVSPEFRPVIKKIKDVAAGAVLISALGAVTVGCIIFIPYLLKFFS